MKNTKGFLLTVLSIMILLGSSCTKRQNIKYENVFKDKEAEINLNEPSLRGTNCEDSFNLKVVYFNFDRSDPTTSSLESLKENLVYLTTNPNVKIVLEGHTDERGTTEYNLSLGQRRALKIKEYYTRFGIASDRIATISYGKEKPADLGKNELAWSKNRRVETKYLR
ncbi:MAG: OmpA family protein [Endomicrobium sp.]|jgi:peptidoglycan-associated lipoprotein|nr:OmpA family protein [Endomicrobium sp.]